MKPEPAAEPPVLLDVWSDYVCPFCYLELPVLQRVMAEQDGAVAVRWHAFELRPDPVPTLDPAGDYLRDIWARSVYPMAAERGMLLRLPPVQPRSRKAMEAAEFARDAGRFDAMHAALFRAFFQDGLDLAATDVLLATGRSVGLDVADLDAALQSGRYADRVRRDQREAEDLGITGVPALIVRRPGQSLREGLAFAGARPFEAITGAIARVRSASATRS